MEWDPKPPLQRQPKMGLATSSEDTGSPPSQAMPLVTKLFKPRMTTRAALAARRWSNALSPNSALGTSREPALGEEVGKPARDPKMGAPKVWPEMCFVQNSHVQGNRCHRHFLTWRSRILRPRWRRRGAQERGTRAHARARAAANFSSDPSARRILSQSAPQRRRAGATAPRPPGAPQAPDHHRRTGPDRHHRDTPHHDATTDGGSNRYRPKRAGLPRSRCSGHLRSGSRKRPPRRVSEHKLWALSSSV